MANKENNERDSHFLVDNFNEDVNEEHDYRSENSNQCDTDDEGNHRTHPQSSFISQQWPQTYRYGSFSIYMSFFLHKYNDFNIISTNETLLFVIFFVLMYIKHT